MHIMTLKKDTIPIFWGQMKKNMHIHRILHSRRSVFAFHDVLHVKTRCNFLKEK